MQPGQASTENEFEITPEMIEAGKRAFYREMDMLPFSDATVTDLVSTVACAVISEFRSGGSARGVQR